MAPITQRLTTATTRLFDDTPPALHRGALALLIALLVAAAIGWSPQSATPAPALSHDTTHAGHASRPLERPAPPAAFHPLATSVPPTDVPVPPTEQIIAVMRELPSGDPVVATAAAPTAELQLDQTDPRCTGATGTIDPSCGLSAAQLREAMDH
jgi:hypothetical protein